MADASQHLSALLHEAHELQQTSALLAVRQRSVQDYLKQLRVGCDEWGNRTIDSHLVKAAKRAREIIERELTAEAAAEHRREMERRSTRLEQIRSAISQLTGQVVIELGVAARALLVEEATTPLDATQDGKVR